MKRLQCIIVLCFSFALITSNAQTNTYYLDPDGNDANDGSQSQPWKTLNFALKESNIKKGDTLLLQPGRYSEPKVIIKKTGAINEWITVLGITENGQRPVFDGTNDTLSNKNNWRLVANSHPIYGGKQIYEYKTTVPRVEPPRSVDLHRGFFEFRSQKNALIAYKTREHFVSAFENSRIGDSLDYGNYYYAGPGTYYDTLTNKLYLRLKVPTDTIVPENRTIKVNNNHIPLNHSKLKLELATVSRFSFVEFRDQNINHIRFRNIEFYNYGKTIFLSGGAKNTNNIEFRDLKFVTTNNSLKLQRVHDVKVEYCDLTGHIPLYVGFQETKGDFMFKNEDGSFTDSVPLPARSISFEAITFSNDPKNITISNCSFAKMFDALSVTNSHTVPSRRPENVTIKYCYFKRLLDDAISISADGVNVNIHNNKYEDVPVGLSLTKAPIGLPISELGQVYFHHNIVMECPRFANRANHNQDTYIFNMRMPLLVTHNDVNIGPFALKAYHNTFILRNGYKDRWVERLKTTTLVVPYVGDGKGDPLDLAIVPQVSNEIYNNIFFYEKIDYSIMRQPFLHNGRDVYDGNLYYRTTAGKFPYEPLFRHMFRDASGDAITGTFETLTDVYSDTVYDQTQAYNSALTDIAYDGFESRGIVSTSLPITMNTWKPIAGGDAASGAIPLGSKSWPGLVGEIFRGAKPPVSSSSRLAITPTRFTFKTFPNPFAESLSISYSLDNESEVTLILTDLNGRIIKPIINRKHQPKGYYSLKVNTDNLPQGIYFCQLQIGNHKTTKKVNLIR